MSKKTDRVRCFSCGRRQSRAAEFCSRCAAPFHGMCSCGAQYGFFDDACAACGAEVVPRELPLRRRPAVRWLRRLVAVALLAGVGWLALAPRPVPAWELKRQGLEHFAEEDYETAADEFRRATELKPGDAEAWHMLALTYRALDMGPETVVPVLRRALGLRPDLVEALRLMATLEVERGRFGAALAYARRTVRAGGARPQDLQFVAQLEFAGPRPDLGAVARTLREARAAGSTDPGVRVLLAEVLLLRHGDSPDVALLPEVAQALREAEEAVAPEAAADLPAGRAVLFRWVARRTPSATPIAPCASWTRRTASRRPRRAGCGAPRCTRWATGRTPTATCGPRWPCVRTRATPSPSPAA
jgi:hypothetical protein